MSWKDRFLVSTEWKEHFGDSQKLLTCVRSLLKKVSTCMINFVDIFLQFFLESIESNRDSHFKFYIGLNLHFITLLLGR